jgi:FixJ family two-component response regulator
MTSINAKRRARAVKRILRLGQPLKAGTVVYIVDDDESVRRALRRLVESLGLRAETFSSPAEYLGSDVDSEPSCLLLDVQLPGMDGFELHQRIVDSGSTPPVIFITAHPNAETRSKAAEADAVAYLEKPFDDRRLLAALDAALDRIKGGPASPA